MDPMGNRKKWKALLQNSHRFFPLSLGTKENFHISQSSPARARSRPASAWAEVHLPAVRAKSEWGLVASPLTASGPHHHPRLPSSGWWHPTRGRQTNEAIGPSSQGKLQGHIPKNIPDFIANIMSSTMFHWGSYMRPFMIPSNVLLCEPGPPQHAKFQPENKVVSTSFSKLKEVHQH